MTSFYSANVGVEFYFFDRTSSWWFCLSLLKLFSMLDWGCMKYFIFSKGYRKWMLLFWWSIKGRQRSQLTFRYNAEGLRRKALPFELTEHLLWQIRDKNTSQIMGSVVGWTTPATIHTSEANLLSSPSQVTSRMVSLVLTVWSPTRDRRKKCAVHKNRWKTSCC